MFTTVGQKDFIRLQNTYEVIKSIKCSTLFLIMALKSLLSYYNNFIFSQTKLSHKVVVKLLVKTFFLKEYFLRNELIWQEGLLIDFLQKKTTDKWVRRFLIVSAYIINERLFYDRVIKFYLNLFIWPGSKKMVFEFSSIGQTLFVLLFLLLGLFLLVVFWYFFTLLVL